MHTDATAETITTLPNFIRQNNNYGSNSKSIFIPASTSKYPIEQNTIGEDLRERFVNFLAQWIRAFVYLSRK